MSFVLQNPSLCGNILKFVQQMWHQVLSYFEPNYENKPQGVESRQYSEEQRKYFFFKKNNNTKKNIEGGG